MEKHIAIQNLNIKLKLQNQVIELNVIHVIDCLVQASQKGYVPHIPNDWINALPLSHGTSIRSKYEANIISINEHICHSCDGFSILIILEYQSQIFQIGLDILIDALKWLEKYHTITPLPTSWWLAISERYPRYYQEWLR